MKTEESAARLGLLYEVAEKASSAPEVSKLLEETLSITQRILRASASSLFLIDQERGELFIHAAGGNAAGDLKQVRLNRNSGIVGWVANHGTPLLVNDVNGDERFHEDIDRATGFATRSILAVPLVRARRVIGVLELLNKVDGGEFSSQDLRVLTGLMSTEALIMLVSIEATAIANIKASQPVLDGYKHALETLASSADATEEPYARDHSRRVKDYTMLAARAMSHPPTERQAIEFGALLHDVGKIGIDDSILRKAGPLSAEERAIIRKHPLTGASIVGEIPCLEKARSVVLYHHERWDGKGYPEGLAGEAIPMGARLVAVADAFDTMTTQHSYRASILSVDEAIGQLTEGRSTQFCPVAVDAFVAEIKKQKERLAKENELARQKLATEITQKAVRDTDAPAYGGEVRLVIPRPARFESVAQFRECLQKVEGLKVMLTGWSEGEGNIILLSLQQPTALEDMLKEMPAVDGVGKKGKDVVVVLKVPPPAA